MRRSGMVLMVLAVLWAGPALTETEHGTVEDVRALIRAGDYAKAETAAREALSRLRSELGEAAPETAEVLDVLLETLWRGGKASDPATQQLGEEALALKRRVLGFRHPSIGRTLHQLAMIATHRNKFDMARRQWEEGIVLMTEGLGPDHPDVAKSQAGLAGAMRVLGGYFTAEELLRSALATEEKTHGAQDPSIAPVLDQLSSLLFAMARYEQAIVFGDRSVEILERELGADAPELATALARLAGACDRAGHPGRARAHYERALQIRESRDEDRDLIAESLQGLAMHLHRSGKSSEALPLLDRALAIRQDRSDPGGQSGVLHDLAAVLESLGQVEQARAHVERSVSHREETLGPEHPDVAESLTLLGELLLRTGAPDSAHPLFDRAATLLVDAYGDDYLFVARVLAGQARALAGAGDVAGAVPPALESDRIAREFVRLAGPALAGQYLHADPDDGLDLVLTLVADGSVHMSREALDGLIRSRTIKLDEAAVRSRLVTDEAKATSIRIKRYLYDLQTRLANLSARGREDLEWRVYEDLILHARDSISESAALLNLSSPRYRREQELNVISVDDIDVFLPASSALVAFTLYDHVDLRPSPDVGEVGKKKKKKAGRDETPGGPIPSYMAIVLRSDTSEITAIPLGSAASLDSLIDEWSRAAARGSATGASPDGPEDACLDAGLRLRERIWDPLAAHIDGAFRVFIVPDGTLNLVNLAALPDGNGGYLIEHDRVLHYLSAERDLSPVSNKDLGRGMLAVGGPDYDDTSSFESLDVKTAPPSPACEGLTSLRFEPLPDAERGTSEIAEFWRDAASGRTSREGVAIVSGGKASEKVFKQRSEGARILHVATRGFPIEAECTNATADGGLLSPFGLAFAGANHRQAAAIDEEDGLLTTAEIAALDLTGVEWVVLSASGGTGGIQSGEHLLSLQRATRIAGAHTLIAALWPMDDDQSARQWMRALYRGRLEQALDTALAAREAGRSVLRARREEGESTHPYYWASYRVAGDWR